MHFELLRLTKLPSAEVAQRSSALWISRTTISSMHFQIIQAQEELKAVVAAESSFAVVKLLGVLHDVFLSQNGDAADLAMILSYG